MHWLALKSISFIVGYARNEPDVEETNHLRHLPDDIPFGFVFDDRARELAIRKWQCDASNRNWRMGIEKCDAKNLWIVPQAVIVLSAALAAGSTAWSPLLTPRSIVCASSHRQPQLLKCNRRPPSSLFRRSNASVVDLKSLYRSLPSRKGNHQPPLATKQEKLCADGENRAFRCRKNADSADHRGC